MLWSMTVLCSTDSRIVGVFMSDSRYRFVIERKTIERTWKLMDKVSTLDVFYAEPAIVAVLSMCDSMPPAVRNLRSISKGVH